MPSPIITYRIAFAAATDCADRHMRQAGRTEWSMDDLAAGVREFERLYGPPQWADSIIQPREVA